MQLEVKKSGQADPLLISEGIYWYLLSSFNQFAEETDTCVDLDGSAEIENETLPDFYRVLESIAEEVRVSSEPMIKEVGLTEERDQIMMFETPQAEGLAMIEKLMAMANEAHQEGDSLLIRGVAK